MDLEGFELDHFEFDTTAADSQSIPDALKRIDAEWHTASKRTRWMDLLGDYAGTEPFIIDGHSLIQMVVDDPLLALGKLDDPSFQILHAFYILECTLDKFIKRSARFDIVFWEETRHLALRTGVGDFEGTSRSLAHKLLFNHLQKIPQVSVYVFTDLFDPKWKEYQFLQKPMFVLVNESDTDQDPTGPFFAERHLCHRVFLFDLLTSGIALALLAGVEFRDSKVLSFVYDSGSSRENVFDSSSIRVAYSTATRALEEQGKNDILISSSASTEPLKTIATEDVVLEVASLTRFSGHREKALFFAFLIHLLLLPHLSTQDRARKPEVMTTRFKHQLISGFLPTVFRAIEAAITSLSTTIDIDVRVFIALVHFLAKNNPISFQDIFRNDVAKIVEDKLSSFSIPISAFKQFAADFRPATSLVHQSAENRLRLLPFTNRIFDDELSLIRNLNDVDCARGPQIHEMEEAEPGNDGGSGNDEWDTSSEENAGDKRKTQKRVSEVPTTGYFNDSALYRDAQHNHNKLRVALPEQRLGGNSLNMTELERKKKLRSDQRFMKTLHDQAATLTGASGATLRQIKILPVGVASSQPPSKKQSYTRSAGLKGSQKQSKADIIREQNLAQKAQKQLNESITWLTERIHDLDTQQSMSSLEKMLSDLKRNPKSSEPFIAAGLALYRLHRMFQSWISDPERESATVRDGHSITALRTIKDVLEINYLTSEMRKYIQDALNILGFSAYTNTLIVASTTQEDRPLPFKFVKLVKSKTQEPLHAFMRIQEHPIEWQLRLFGEYMDRSMDGQADSRVAFKPDAWQRKVLDAIDDNKSLLVVAPTSAGKTFISYYAMEKVLRGSDDGVIVYVAPTKALVSQVTAEVYARFNKDLHGRSCWAIYTKEYQIHDPQNCQILVTIPEVLANMMHSPPLAKVWTPHIKYIILDEIHSIGQQEGGSVWEQILFLAPCPIIGLSATVGEPEKFNAWLEAVQKAGGFQHTFVHHTHRYSHLRKFFYNIHERSRGTFESISTHKSTGRMRFLHPIAMLAFGPRSIPADLTLEASDTLSLYRALVAHGDLPSSTLDKLNPLKFFTSTNLLQQKDVIAYDVALKACLAPMVAQFDSRDVKSPLYKTIARLQDRALHQVAPDAINKQPTRASFKANLLHLVCDLHAQGDLPAMFFNPDRSNCENMAMTLQEAILAAEEKWRTTNPEWQHKLSQYEEWLSRAKDRARAAARAAKNKPDPDKVKTETQVEWQATFDPDAPLPQFSFVGQRTSYTQSMLEEELEYLERRTWTPSWALVVLRRGIAVHHDGMNKHYKAIVESLYRQGFIRVIFSTDTLALGINAPTKTSIFCGDSPLLTALSYRQCAGRAGRRGYDLLGKVVFYGIPMDRVQRLVLSKLPSLRANLPVTSTLVLRLFNLLEGSEYAPAVVNTVKRLLRLPQVSFGSEEGKYQLLYRLRFSIDYLRRACLLDEQGRLFNLFRIASQLHHTEPSNFALVTLLRHGVVHRICAQPDFIQAKRNFILLMSHLFGRRYLPTSYLKDENMAKIIKRSPSMVILPPLPDDARRVLAEHEEEILRIFTEYALTYYSEHNSELGPDTLLPLSGIEYCGTPYTRARFATWLQDTALKVVARSLFVANSGYDDRFESVEDLSRTAWRGLNLTEHAVPSLGPIFGTCAGVKPVWNRDKGRSWHSTSTHAKSHPHAHGFALNAYILDFYTHGQVRVLNDANGIRRGEVWYMLKEFSSTLTTVQDVLKHLIMRKPVRMNADTGECEGFDTDLDSGFIEADDPTEKEHEDDGHDTRGKKGMQTKSLRGAGHPVKPVQKPSWVAKRDWRVLEVIRGATTEFDEKFKEMWA